MRKVKELYVITEESKHNKTSSQISDFNSAVLNMSGKQAKGNEMSSSGVNNGLVNLKTPEPKYFLVNNGSAGDNTNDSVWINKRSQANSVCEAPACTK